MEMKLWQFEHSHYQNPNVTKRDCDEFRVNSTLSAHFSGKVGVVMHVGWVWREFSRLRVSDSIAGASFRLVSDCWPNVRMRARDMSET